MEHEAAFSCGFLFAVVSFVLKRWDVSTLGRRVQESVVTVHEGLDRNTLPLHPCSFESA